MKTFYRILILMCTLVLLPVALLACQRQPSQDDPIDDPSDDPADPPSPDDGWTRVAAQESVTDYLTLHGRTYIERDVLKLFWTYSGFSLRFDGTGVRVSLTTSTTNPSYPGFLKVYVDGEIAPSATIKVDRAGKYTLISGLTPGVHTIEVRKSNEATYGESATLGVKSITVTDGSFITQAPEEPEFRMEVIGDSITSGFGNMVTDGSGAGFTTLTQDGTMTYATLTGRALGADVHVLSRSGICYVSGTDRDSIRDYYTQVAALPNREYCTDAWDFDEEPNDIVVINLGTNDSGASIDGKQITADQMCEQAIDFLRFVRENNPDALIVWAYGMIDQGRANAFRTAVATLNEEGDDDVYFVLLPLQDRTLNGVGVHGHPSIQSHILAAEVLTEALSELTGRAVDDRVLIDAQVRCIEEYRLTDRSLYVSESLDDYDALLSFAKEQEDTLSYQEINAQLRDDFAALPRAED